ncbi:MAG TPA: aspartate kinase, partial [Bacillota bacterium]|nr:aspartate kinase [Bacillota bacterium]
MIVCKFGGSSLSDAAQIRKACAILLENSERKIMVVSAPGKRRGIQGDTKFTDVLIFAAEEIFAGRGGAEELRVISTRLRETARDLCLPSSLAAALISEINLLAGELASKRARTRDALLAMGEISAARMVAAFLQKEGCNARFVDPREAGLLLARADGTTC